jgi:hypothetical protein
MSSLLGYRRCDFRRCKNSNFESKCWIPLGRIHTSRSAHRTCSRPLELRRAQQVASCYCKCGTSSIRLSSSENTSRYPMGYACMKSDRRLPMLRRNILLLSSGSSKSKPIEQQKEASKASEKRYELETSRIRNTNSSVPL